MDVKRPYFMENKEWYYYDDEEGIFKLTDKATKEAIKSYEEFYNENDTEIEERENKIWME